VEIVKEGDKLDLGGRTLEVIEIPDHACGSIALLDSRERILFSGDEVIGFFKKINGTIDKVLEQMKKLRDRNSEFDIIWPGPGDSCSPQIIDRYIETLEYLKAGGVGEPGFGLNFPQKEPQPESQPIEGKTIYDRFKARPCDQKVQNQSPDEEIYHINKFGILVIYDKAKL
jgi:glyoxylase-like metal-dependent hydrolase (beta-lactamase superfamily II)